jgi:hypothetical protein
MIEEVIATGTTNGLRGRVTGNAFRTLVPVSDHAVAVYEIDAVVQVIDNILVKILFISHRISGGYLYR